MATGSTIQKQNYALPRWARCGLEGQNSWRSCQPDEPGGEPHYLEIISKPHALTLISNKERQCHKGHCDFAVKEFGNPQDFQDELEALKLFSGDRKGHEHLIKVLAAFSQCGRDFLIFPLAEGSLDKFWQQWDASPPQNALWLIEQCHGLTEGLQHIHQYVSTDLSNDVTVLGRHGDIKPQNILWFQDSSNKNRLVLSDFTLMRFHTKGSNQETTMDRISGTKTYRAPEVEVKSHHHVSQGYDVWSLGCVFLEMISCYLVGYKATYERAFKGADGQNYQSFQTVREMNSVAAIGYLDEKYFLYMPGKPEAELKKSVEYVS